MTADDCRLFDELLVKYQEGHAEGRHFTTNYEKMCIEHNAIALDESYLPIEIRRRIFAKTVPILKAHHKELKARENSKRTERQIVAFFDHTTSITHSTTVKRGISKIRDHMKENASRLTFQGPLPRPPQRQEPMASAVQHPTERTILFVPPPELQKATVVVTCDGPSHIKMPPPIQNRAVTATNELPNPQKYRASQRCYRCGWARVGSCHKKRVATNTLEYCTKPDSERYPNWKVPYGYGINDEPTARIRNCAMKRQWHQKMEENGIHEDPHFPDWNPKIK